MELHDMISETFSKCEEDRKEKCINCGEVWYSIHYKNGYCSECQKNGLHLKKNINFSKILYYIIGALLIVYLIAK